MSQPQMNVYPFIIRGPTDSSRRKRIYSQGINFKNALVKVLSVFPAKFVNFKYAKTMDLITVKNKAIKLSKASKGIEHRIWLNEKEGEFYVTFLNGENCTMLVEEEETDPVEIGSARLNKFKLQSIWLNGEQQADESSNGKETTKTKNLKEKSVKTAVKMKPVKKLPAKVKAKNDIAKKEKIKTVPRGNNMFLTEAEWKKVDALLAKENVSFSAWSRGLVQAEI